MTEGPQPTTSPSPTKAPVDLPVAGDVQAVSASHPSSAAADAMAKCQIGDSIPIQSVAGMAQIAAAKDIARYVPLTGREPQLREVGPAWIVQIRGDVPFPLSGEVWTDPTCVVTPSDFGFYGTGPIRNTSTDVVTTPEPPAALPDLALPTLAP
ncbi:MAG: hypothetical protein V4515_04225 [Chloroflexota bacterium]